MVKTSIKTRTAAPSATQVPKLMDDYRVEVVSSEEMAKHYKEISGLSNYFTDTWKQKFIKPCVEDPNSINILMRNREDEIVGYLTGGMVEKYDLYHPCVGKGNAFMPVGMGTKPGQKDKGIGRSMLKAARMHAISKGYTFWASFTQNPRLKHLMDDTFELVDSRSHKDNKNIYTYLLIPGDVVDLKKELDVKDKRPIKVDEENKLLGKLRDLPEEKIPMVARKIAKDLYV